MSFKLKSCFQASRFKRIQSRLRLAFLALSLIPLTVMAVFFFNSHTQDLKNQSTAYLISIRDHQKQQILNYFHTQDEKVKGMVRSELAYATGGRFYGLINAFQNLGEDIQSSREYAQHLEFLNLSSHGLDERHEGNQSIVDKNAAERYRLLHKRYHESFLDWLNRSDFSDILLVDLQGNVAYSAQTSNEFGKDLTQGKLADSELGKTFAKLKQTTQDKSKKDADTSIVYSSVIEYYTQNEAPPELYIWIGAPIIKQGYLHSYMLFKLPLERFSQILLDAENDKNIQKILVDQTFKNKIQGQQTSVVESNRNIIDIAFQGDGVGSLTNDAKQTFFSAFTQVKFHQNNWAFIVQTPEEKAFAQINHLKKVFFTTFFIAILLVFLCSHYLSNFITRPLLKLSWIAESISAGDLNQTVLHTEREDEVGRLAKSFARMQSALKDKIEVINTQNRSLENQIKIIEAQNYELQQADELKDKFLATTSHELRTPLHGMIGIAEALTDKKNGKLNAHQAYQLEIIINSGRRLSGLVDDLLDYHKMRYGHLDVDISAVDLHQSFDHILEMSSHLIGQKNLKVHNLLPHQLPLVDADPQRLEQVLYNLIDNAIKYTASGYVHLIAQTYPHSVRIQITDTGQGIEDDMLPHIFEPLTQAKVQGMGYRAGAGLGLSICCQLIEIMGGHLFVSSQVGQGTSFSFHLPIAASQPQIQDTHAFITPSSYNKAQSEEAISTDKMRDTHEHSQALGVSTDHANTHHEIQDTHVSHTHQVKSLESKTSLVLVVDDEEVNRQILAEFLQLEGYQSAFATNGQEAIQFVEHTKPDIVLLDIMMPVLDGYQTCEALRLQYSANELPIIMLTALSHSRDQMKGFELGANDYLIKPFERHILAARMKVHLQASQTHLKQVENTQLAYELRWQENSRQKLIETQQQLLSLLNLIDEPILALNQQGKIDFANPALEPLMQVPLDKLMQMDAAQLIASPYLEIKQSQSQVEIEIFSADERRKILADIFILSQHSGIQTIYVFHPVSPEKARIQTLEKAIEALSRYAFNGEVSQLEALPNISHEFVPLVKKVTQSAQDPQLALREHLVDTMNLGLEYWQAATGMNKFDLAKQSDLWRVYLDRSSLQTRTLDKYLHIETLPKTPRWKTVMSTLDYILEHTQTTDTPMQAQNHQLKLKLQAYKHKLQQMMEQAKK